MMNMPSLPTDNLYKFLALSGLVIVLFSFIFPMKRIGELKLKVLEVNTQIEVLGIEIDDLGYDTALWAKKAILNPKETVLLRKRTMEIKIKSAELKGRMEQNKALLQALEYYWRFIQVTIWLGLVISLAGFHLWYFLVQKPNDLLLRKQIKKEKI